MGMVGEACLPSEPTTRGRLITPFVLGSMSVGLNILIRHSFMDLWVWITALVPWPELFEKKKLVVTSNFMLNTKFQDNWLCGSGEEEVFSTFLGMAAILVMRSGPFEQTCFPHCQKAAYEI